MAKNQAAVFIPEPETIMFGAGEHPQYLPVKEVPLARIKRFQPLWFKAFERVKTIQKVIHEAEKDGTQFGIESLFEEFYELAMDAPFQLLSILYIGLDEELFMSEEEGASPKQIIDALDKGLEVNGLGWLKKQLPFIRSLIPVIDLSSLDTMDDSPKTDSSLESA